MYLSDLLTIPSCMAGLPGLNVPCGLSEGLPVGLQLIGPQFSENTLFRIGHALEQAIGFDPVPERLAMTAFEDPAAEFVPAVERVFGAHAARARRLARRARRRREAPARGGRAGALADRDARRRSSTGSRWSRCDDDIEDALREAKEQLDERAEWEPVIGLEVHAHLKTRTKMFCRCELEYGAAENTHTCPVCLAHPGALPVPNARAIELTILLGLALDCEIAERAVFARKNYFYPDLPKGYQISQYEAPLCGPGRFVIPTADGDARDRHRARAPRGGRGEDGARRRRDRPLASAPTTASSTSTAAARRCSRSSASPTSARPTRRCATSACCGRRSSSSASPTRRWRRARCAPTSTSRCASAARRASGRAGRSRT